ncbi:MAG: hypothetical protein AAB383_03910 [Patescibacteria group bacterium]
MAERDSEPEDAIPAPQGISRRGLLVGSSAGLVGGLGVGGAVGSVMGFGYGAGKAAEVAPGVMVDVASRELGERTAELGAFWGSVKPLILQIIAQTGEFLNEVKAKGTTWDGVKMGASTLWNGFKKDAVEWMSSGDTSLDKTVEEISRNVESDPVLGPKWRAILKTYTELQDKQEEFATLSARLTTVSEADKEELKADVKRELTLAVQKDFPWATSAPESESPKP